MTDAPAPDSRLVAAVHPSPNHDARRRAGRPDAIVLHYTGMADGRSALERLCDPAAEVSCHYLVEEDGAVLQLVPEALRAWHAGRGVWAGEDELNSASIGIEIVNGGHDFGLPDFPDAQIESVVALCRDVMGRNGIAPARLLAHSDLAPTRKQDPGERFPWDRLAAAGLAIWVEASDDLSTGLPLDAEEVQAVQAELARLGFGIDATGVHDGASRSVIEAFQRRHRPARVDGAMDPGTRDTLKRLLALHGR